MTRMTETLPDLTYRYQILKPVTTAATACTEFAKDVYKRQVQGFKRGLLQQIIRFFPVGR